jgi:hypothetical protein
MKFKRDSDAAEKFQIGIYEIEKLQNSIKAN